MTNIPVGARLTELGRLRQHLDRLQAASDLAPEVLVQDLETIYEELRTSEEEVRVQQEQISRLVSDQATEHRQNERLMALLPVAALTTDLHGMVRSANVAAAGLLRVPVERLVDKPVLVLVAPEGRLGLRRRLSEAARQQVRQVVTLLRRDRSPIDVEVVITPRPGPRAELSWVLFPADGHAEEQVEGRQRLTWALMGLPEILRSVEDRAALLTRAAAVVRDAVDHDAAVSISLGSPLEPVAVGTTPGAASHVDAAQMAAGEGPGVDAFSGRTTVTSDDARTDRRWPRLARHLPEGVGPVVAVPMTADGDTAGVLTILLPPGRTAAGALQAAGVFAVTVPALVAELGAKAALADLAGDLRRAMESRAVIEQAKGIIMAERHCDDEAAFAHLVRLSSSEHVKLRDLARTIVARASGAEPPRA